MGRTQTLVQLTDELLAELDARGAREHRSRSDLIREAIEQFLRDEREAAIDRAIVDGYTRRPQRELAGAEWAARSSIAQEPWEQDR